MDEDEMFDFFGVNMEEYKKQLEESKIEEIESGGSEDETLTQPSVRKGSLKG